MTDETEGKPALVINRTASARSPAREVEGDPDQIIAFPCFGARRYQGQEKGISIEGDNGSLHGFSYRHLVQMEYAPENGITLWFTSHRVQITGKTLKVLYDFLVRHAVNFIKAIDSADAFGDDVTVIVNAISVEENQRFNFLLPQIIHNHK